MALKYVDLQYVFITEEDFNNLSINKEIWYLEEVRRLEKTKRKSVFKISRKS